MRKQQVGNAFGTAASHHAYKDARRHKNEDHGDDIFIPDAVAHQLQLGVKGKLAILQAGHQQGNEKRHDDRNIVKTHVDLKTVLKQQTKA